MKQGLPLGAILLWLAGNCQPVTASDWAESPEVRSRFERMRARPMKQTVIPYVVEEHGATQATQRNGGKAWRSIAYDAIAPRESQMQPTRNLDRKIEVAEADKLGYQLNNPVMRDKVLELYRRPGIVVEQYVIGQ